MLMERAISCEFLDIDHFREQLRGWDTPAIQIERGRINISLRSIDLGGLIFADIRVNRKVIDHSRIEAGWFNFVISFSPAIFCGIETGAGHLTVLAPGREYRSVLTSAWHSLEITVSSSVLADEGLTVPSCFVSDPKSATIPLPAELVGVFRRLSEAAFGSGGNGFVDIAFLRRALLQTLDRALNVGMQGWQLTDHRRAAEGYELAHRMIRYIESRFGQRVTVNEVAGELDVTPRALHYATRSALGMSPLDVIVAFRLNHVRNELWDTRLSDASITRAAMTQDFGHLGRFSQQYRALFGESPSQTLDRIRSL